MRAALSCRSASQGSQSPVWALSRCSQLHGHGRPTARSRSPRDLEHDVAPQCRGDLVSSASPSIGESHGSGFSRNAVAEFLFSPLRRFPTSSSSTLTRTLRRLASSSRTRSYSNALSNARCSISSSGWAGFFVNVGRDQTSFGGDVQEFGIVAHTSSAASRAGLPLRQASFQSLGSSVMPALPGVKQCALLGQPQSTAHSKLRQPGSQADRRQRIS